MEDLKWFMEKKGFIENCYWKRKGLLKTAIGKEGVD